MRLFTYLCVACLLVPVIMGASGDEAMLGGVVTSNGEGFSNQPLIVTVQPNDYGQMVEMTEFSEGAASIEGGSQMPSDRFNALWVVDDTGEMNDDLSVPLYSYARVFITPSQGGNLVVEKLCPDDQLQTNNMGMVEPIHTYGIWFYGDMPGTYQIRYNVNGGEYSNVAEFYVS